MIGTRTLGVIAGFALVLSATTIPAGAEATATVLVDANAFSPFEAAVDVSGTVTWVVQEGGHTIAADDGRFRFTGAGGSTLAAGTTVAFQFAGDELVGYHCEIHGGPAGQGMAGRVRVGDPAPPPTSPDPVINVPGDAPTLAAAVAIAAPGHRIELGAGDHPVVEPVAVALDRLTIAGDAAGSRLVPVPDSRGFPTTALHITGSHVRVENLRIAAFRSSGIDLDGADAAELVGVSVDGAGFTADGIVLRAVTGATLRSATVTGTRGAGVLVSSCSACGVLLDAARSTGNGIGVLVEAARGVIVRDSFVEANGIGVLARTARTTAPLRPAVVTLSRNTIAGNPGGGVRLVGPSDALVEGNIVSGSAAGIVVGGDWAERTEIRGNRVEGSLAWDGVGIHVTFTGNTDLALAPKDPTIGPAAMLP